MKVVASRCEHTNLAFAGPGVLVLLATARGAYARAASLPWRPLLSPVPPLVCNAIDFKRSLRNPIFFVLRPRELVPSVRPETTSYVATINSIYGDPHMRGLSGQRIDWSGVDGGWYSLIKDEKADLDINVRLTAPLSRAPTASLVADLTVLSGGALSHRRGRKPLQDRHGRLS